MQKTLITAIPAEKQKGRGWKVSIDGKPVENVAEIIIDNSKFGTLKYGLTPGGYDGWAFREIGGGGIVTIPYAIISGRLFVGMVKQNRHNQGGLVWNAPAGFLDPGESNFEALEREFEEEVGWLSPDRRVKPLGKKNGNPNNAFFETPEEGMGIGFFGVEILPEQLIKNPEIEGTFTLKGEKIKAVSKIAEQIMGCVFWPWRQAALVGDMKTNTAVARLLATQAINL